MNTALEKLANEVDGQTTKGTHHHDELNWTPEEQKELNKKVLLLLNFQLVEAASLPSPVGLSSKEASLGIRVQPMIRNWIRNPSPLAPLFRCPDWVFSTTGSLKFSDQLINIVNALGIAARKACSSRVPRVLFLDTIKT